MPSEKNVVREGGLWPFQSRCQKVNSASICLQGMHRNNFTFYLSYYKAGLEQPIWNLLCNFLFYAYAKSSTGHKKIDTKQIHV